jgi:predicted hydrocarbon binding protein
MTDRKCRGSTILGYYKYARKTWGAAGAKELATSAKFDPEELKEGGWYDDAINDRILDWIAKTKGKEYLIKSNRYLVQDLGLLSYIVRFMDASTILKKLPANYKDVFNYGRVVVEIEAPGAAKVRIYEAATSEYSCPAWLGVFQGMFEMTHTKGKAKEVQCQFKGAPHCVFELTWEK